jgi:hypothetical protein
MYGFISFSFLLVYLLVYGFRSSIVSENTPESVLGIDGSPVSNSVGSSRKNRVSLSVKGFLFIGTATAVVIVRKHFFRIIVFVV